MIICRWKVHGTTTHCPLTVALRKISQHALRLKVRKLREKTLVTEKELRDDLKAAGTTVTRRAISNELRQKTYPFIHPTQNSSAKKEAQTNQNSLEQKIKPEKIKEHFGYIN